MIYNPFLTLYKFKSIQKRHKIQSQICFVHFPRYFFSFWLIKQEIKKNHRKVVIWSDKFGHKKKRLGGKTAEILDGSIVYGISAFPVCECKRMGCGIDISYCVSFWCVSGIHEVREPGGFVPGTMAGGGAHMRYRNYDSSE